MPARMSGLSRVCSGVNAASVLICSLSTLSPPLTWAGGHLHDVDAGNHG